MSLSSEITSSGSIANHTGNQLELFLENALISHGYAEFWNHKTQAFENRKSIGGKQYLKQLPCGNTIYQKPRHVDFLIINRKKFPNDLIIECKWQQSRGSVDEKYPFLLFNIIKTGVPTVILLDGNGYSKHAKQWLAEQADTEMHRALIGVWSMMEFQTQINKGFLG
jgi:PD-(D/E)XK nuclease superfamily domain